MLDIFSNFPNPSNKPCFNPHEYNPNQRPDMHGSVYLSPRKPCALKFFDGYLYEIEIGDDFLKISRHIGKYNDRQNWDHLVIERYDKNNVLIDRRDEMEDEDTTFDYENLSETLQMRVQLLTPQSGYSYAIVKLHNFPYIPSVVCFRMEECILRSNEYAYIECNNGIIQVNKQILSDVSTYFKQLFQNTTTNKYLVDIDLFDFMQLIYVLPPYNKPIYTGRTYRLLYDLAYRLKCVGLADFCVRFMTDLKRYAPLLASRIAYQAGVNEEAQLYINRLKASVFDCETQIVKEERLRAEVIYSYFKPLCDYVEEPGPRSR